MYTHIGTAHVHYIHVYPAVILKFYFKSAETSLLRLRNTAYVNTHLKVKMGSQ